jgi:hypothetical protein
VTPRLRPCAAGRSRRRGGGEGTKEEEGATLLFYAFVGASFRPRAVGESYAHLTDEELAEIEL